MPEPRELPLGLAEIAQLLGIQRRSVDRMKARGSLPEPDGYVSGSPVWWRETIETWAVGRRRRG